MGDERAFVGNSPGLCGQDSAGRRNPLASADAGKPGSVTQLERDLINVPDPIYTVDDAAHVCGMSTATIRRRLAKGMKGAYREGHGSRASWRIPRQTLVNAGLLAGAAEEESLTTYDYERVIAAKDEVIDALRRLAASQESRLSMQADLIAHMETMCAPSSSPPSPKA